MNNVLKDRFKDEIETIKGYAAYIENNFYRRSCQVLRTQGFEEFEILKDYVFFTEGETEKEKNRDILAQIGPLIRTKIEECTEAQRECEKVLPPQISRLF